MQVTKAKRPSVNMYKWMEQISLQLGHFHRRCSSETYDGTNVTVAQNQIHFFPYTRKSKQC
jgi:hypothetical protein